MFLFKGRSLKRLTSIILAMLFTASVAMSFLITISARGENDTEEAELVTSDTTEVLFEDVVGHWAELYINAVAKKHFLEGNPNGKFYPDENATRAQLVLALWRISGSPSVDYTPPFTDITTQTDEIRSAVAWAYKNGYISGVSQTKFDPASPITREAAMKILYSYSGGQSAEAVKFRFIYDKTFTDIKSISDWAIDSIYWGLYTGLLNGTDKSTLDPQGMISRAQLAKILIKYIESI